MKVKIKKERLGPGLGTGIDSDGVEHLVMGGDLCYGGTIEAEELEDNPKILILKKVNYQDFELFSKFFDDEGLIALSELTEQPIYSKPKKRIYELAGFWVFPDRHITNQLEYIYSNNLIDQTKIKISGKWAYSSARLPIISVNYSKILSNTLKDQKVHCARYFYPEEKRLAGESYADLYVVTNICEKFLQIQLWQVIGEGDEVLYAHGLIDPVNMKFTHFDLATHYIDPSEIPKLLERKEKMELINKVKWLRLDGITEEKYIKEEDVLSLLKDFFPYSILIDEFYGKALPQFTSFLAD